MINAQRHRDGIRLRPCRQYDMRLESDGTVALVVSGVLARRHAGVYTCTVTNEMGQVSSNARVTIRQRPLAIPSSSLDAISSDHDNIGYVIIAHVLVSSRFFSFFLSFFLNISRHYCHQAIYHTHTSLLASSFTPLRHCLELLLLSFFLAVWVHGRRERGGGHSRERPAACERRRVAHHDIDTAYIDPQTIGHRLGFDLFSHFFLFSFLTWKRRSHEFTKFVPSRTNEFFFCCCGWLCVQLSNATTIANGTSTSIYRDG